MGVRANVHVCACVFVCTHVYVCVCACVRACVCMCVRVCTSIHDGYLNPSGPVTDSCGRYFAGFPVRVS